MSMLKTITDKLDKAESGRDADRKYISQLLERITSLEECLKNQDKLLLAREQQLKVYEKMLFDDSKSQKGTASRTRKPKEENREEKRQNHDGRPKNDTPSGNAPASETETPKTSEPDQKIERSEDYIQHRTGLTYATMKAARCVFHTSDLSKLPEGAEIIRMGTQSYYEQVSMVIEHMFQMITYKTSEGKFHTAYLAMDGDTAAKENFPGTHASTDLLANLAFDKYCISTPLHREIVRYMNDKMQVSRNTLNNWLKKGGKHLKKALKSLKELLLQKDAVVNCDETWYRVKVNQKYGKKYIWCMVNREAKVCVYFYDDGSRGREVLREFLGDTQIAALQSDGYNAYMYLDDKLIDIEHLCCMAHARAKFKYAQEQGSDTRADIFVWLIGRLYDLEEEYKRLGLTPEEIKARRHSKETVEIISKLSENLHYIMKQMEDEGESDKSLMYKAVNYLNSYWKELFAYRNDGRYTIDNSLAERCIRPMTVERNSSLFFGSHKGAEVSVVYHTFVETCKLAGVSVLAYLKKFFSEVRSGRTDYENLLPSTIGLKAGVA